MALGERFTRSAVACEFSFLPVSRMALLDAFSDPRRFKGWREAPVRRNRTGLECWTASCEHGFTLSKAVNASAGPRITLHLLDEPCRKILMLVHARRSEARLAPKRSPQPQTIILGSL